MIGSVILCVYKWSCWPLHSSIVEDLLIFLTTKPLKCPVMLTMVVANVSGLHWRCIMANITWPLYCDRVNWGVLGIPFFLRIFSFLFFFCEMIQ